MLNFGPAFIWAAFNLLVLYILMRLFLFKPVTRFMDNRTKSIKDAISNAEKDKIEAAELKQKYEDQLKSAREDADRIVSEARTRANNEYEAALAAAKEDSKGVLDRAREEIEQERTQMFKEVKGQIVGLALAAASKVIEANMDTVGNRVLVERFIDEEGAA